MTDTEVEGSSYDWKFRLAIFTKVFYETGCIYCVPALYGFCKYISPTDNKNKQALSREDHFTSHY